MVVLWNANRTIRVVTDIMAFFLAGLATHLTVARLASLLLLCHAHVVCQLGRFLRPAKLILLVLAQDEVVLGACRSHTKPVLVRQVTLGNLDLLAVGHLDGGGLTHRESPADLPQHLSAIVQLAYTIVV